MGQFQRCLDSGLVRPMQMAQSGWPGWAVLGSPWADFVLAKVCDACTHMPCACYCAPEQFAEMMRSDVGRNFISTINAKVRRSYTESKLELQAMNEEDREEKELPPTEEEMQEIFERVVKFSGQVHEERERE